jgi:hypothetical protein
VVIFEEGIIRRKGKMRALGQVRASFVSSHVAASAETLVPYMFMRSLWHRGVEAIVRCMKKNPKNTAVQLRGFEQLANFDYVGTVCAAKCFTRGPVELMNAAQGPRMVPQRQGPWR